MSLSPRPQDALLFLSSLFDIAVRTADPMAVIAKHLPAKPKGRVMVIGAGKASARMAEAVEAEWGPCEGLVLTRYGYGRPLQGIELVEAAHPVPDEAGWQATMRMLSLLESLGEDDLVLCLISGGGSSLLCAPADGLDFASKRAVHEALFASGAPIGVMNQVRKHFSSSKGGQLAAKAHPAQMLCLMISDVPGDDPADIASGPTVGENSKRSEISALCDQYNIQLPDAAKVFLEQHGERQDVVAVGSPTLASVTNIVVAAPSQSLQAMAQDAKQLGIESRMLGDDLEGEARDLAREQISHALSLQAEMTSDDAPILLLSGGECTVTGRSGSGIGGPNAEYCLAAALALDEVGATNIFGLACDSDGVDGAAEVAGAIFSCHSIQQAKAAGLDADKALIDHDSHSFFANLGDQIVTGPTLTNVNDIRAILIFPKE